MITLIKLLHLLLIFLKSFFGYFFTYEFSVPFGFILGMGKWWVFLAVYIFNMFQMMFFARIIGKKEYTKIERFFVRNLPQENKFDEKKIVKKMERWGRWGVMCLAGLPFYAGGMWAAILLCHLIGMELKKGYLYMALGAFIGCFITVFGLYGLIYYFQKLFLYVF